MPAGVEKKGQKTGVDEVLGNGKGARLIALSWNCAMRTLQQLGAHARAWEPRPIDALDEDYVAALGHRSRQLVVVFRHAMAFEPDVHDHGRDAATMETPDDCGVDAAGRRPRAWLHSELLGRALVDADDDDVRGRRHRTAQGEQPAETDLFFQPDAKAGGAQQHPQRANEETEQDALAKPHQRGL